MKIIIESTDKIVHINNTPARIWTGKTESGIELHCFITRIAVNNKLDCTEFEKELQIHLPPKPEFDIYPLRMII